MREAELESLKSRKTSKLTLLQLITCFVIIYPSFTSHMLKQTSEL